MKKSEFRPPDDGTKRRFFPNGSPEVEFTIRNGRLHGLWRGWHKNGQLAEEHRYVNGLEHGISKLWDESGRLLASSRFKLGTGINRTWVGGNWSETSMVDGKMTGRMRIWDKSGMLIVEQYFLSDKSISRKKYREFCAKDRRLPRFGDEKISNTIGNWFRQRRKKQREKAKLGLLTEETLAAQKRFDEDCVAETKQSDSNELISWLNRKAKGEITLDEMTHNESLRFARKIYSLGAAKVWAVRIERDSGAGQYSTRVIIALPNETEKHGKIYKVCSDLARPRLNGSLAIFIGKKYMSVSLV